MTRNDLYKLKNRLNSAMVDLGSIESTVVQAWHEAKTAEKRGYKLSDTFTGKVDMDAEGVLHTRTVEEQLADSREALGQAHQENVDSRETIRRLRDQVDSLTRQVNRQESQLRDVGMLRETAHQAQTALREMTDDRDGWKATAMRKDGEIEALERKLAGEDGGRISTNTAHKLQVESTNARMALESIVRRMRGIEREVHVFPNGYGRSK